MDWLFAIAMLCNVSGGWDRKETDEYQLKCQQEYIRCIETYPKESVTPSDWEGPLKHCVKTRAIKK